MIALRGLDLGWIGALFGSDFGFGLNLERTLRWLGPGFVVGFGVFRVVIAWVVDIWVVGSR